MRKQRSCAAKCSDHDDATAGTLQVGSNTLSVPEAVKAARPSLAGYLTVWPCDAPQPNASNVNFAAGGAADSARTRQSVLDPNAACS